MTDIRIQRHDNRGSALLVPESEEGFAWLLEEYGEPAPALGNSWVIEAEYLDDFWRIAEEDGLEVEDG